MTLCVFSLAAVASANVWIDEDFAVGTSGTDYFIQGDGDGNPANATLDVEDADAGNTNVISNVLTDNGIVVTTTAFSGSASYQLDATQSLGVGSPIENPRNGNFVVFQFGINFANAPASTNLATFRYDWDTDDATAGSSTEHSFYVSFDTDGSSNINVTAGEDAAGSSSGSLGTIAADQWAFISMVMQNGAASETYTQANLPGGGITITPGVQFYMDSTTVGHTAPFASANGGAKTFVSWSIDANVNGVFIDPLYWEGAFDLDDTNANINIRPFDTAASGSAVSDWSLY